MGFNLILDDVKLVAQDVVSASSFPMPTRTLRAPVFGEDLPNLRAGKNRCVWVWVWVCKLPVLGSMDRTVLSPGAQCGVLPGWRLLLAEARKCPSAKSLTMLSLSDRDPQLDYSGPAWSVHNSDLIMVSSKHPLIGSILRCLPSKSTAPRMCHSRCFYLRVATGTL